MANVPSITDYVVLRMNREEKVKQYFLGYANASQSEKFAVTREVVATTMGKVGVGEGLVPIACEGNFIIAGYSDPVERKHPVVTNKQCYNKKFHHKLATKEWCNSLSKWITYDMILKHLGVEDLTKFKLNPDLEKYLNRLFVGACNVNPAYRRERYNLVLSLKEYKNFPEVIDSDSIAGMNLTVVAEMLLRMAIIEEDGEGNKKFLKKSELEGNPLIREKVKDMVLRECKKELGITKKEKAEEQPKVEA